MSALEKLQVLSAKLATKPSLREKALKFHKEKAQTYREAKNIHEAKHQALEIQIKELKKLQKTSNFHKKEARRYANAVRLHEDKIKHYS